VAALYADFEAMHDTQPMQESIKNTGAVVMGRNAFAMADDPDAYAGNYEYQVPIFVLTHHPPKKHPKEDGGIRFTFVTEGAESAVAQAIAAAGGRDVTIIGGASTVQQCLRAGLVDELQIDIMPVLLCGGRRPFEDIGIGPIALERIQVTEMPSGRTHHRFRIAKVGSGPVS